MRVSTPWFIAGAVGLFVLIFMMFTYAKNMEMSKYGGITRNSLGATSEQEQALAHRVFHGSVKGVFEENRQSVVSMQQFQPQQISQNRNPQFDYKTAMKELIVKNTPADDPKLVEIIRDYYIQQPSLEPYKLDFPNRLEFSNGQTPFIDSRLNYIEGGFYVECGALNGEKGSNSLFFEKVRKWNGLLIEADPSNYGVLKTKNRKAFSVNACLSPRSTPAKLTFNKAYNRGRIVHDQSAKDWIKRQRIAADPVEIECFPFYSFMLALNRTTIDFFSLDVEGDELNVLKTIPFDKLNIKMLAVEYVHETGGHGQLQTYMEGKGYDTLLKMQRDDGGVNDLIFRKKGLIH